MNLELEPLYIMLQKVYNAPYGYIYLQGDHPWNGTSLGLIYYTDRFDSVLLEEEYPEFVHQHQLQRVMQIDRAEDAMRNAFFQKEQPTYAELVACFNFHYLRSGYLVLSKDGETQE